MLIWQEALDPLPCESSETNYQQRARQGEGQLWTDSLMPTPHWAFLTILPQGAVSCLKGSSYSQRKNEERE